MMLARPYNYIYVRANHYWRGAPNYWRARQYVIDMRANHIIYMRANIMSGRASIYYYWRARLIIDGRANNYI